MTTEYKDLYLTKSRDFELVDEIKIYLFIRNRDDYILWESETKIAEGLGTMDREVCRMKHFGEDDIFKIDTNHNMEKSYMFLDVKTKLGR